MATDDVAALLRILTVLRSVNDVVLGESWYQLGLQSPEELHAAAYHLVGPVRQRLAELGYVE